MSQSAKVYARAFLDYALEKGSDQDTLVGLKEFLVTCSSHAILSEVINSAVVNQETRSGIVKELFVQLKPNKVVEQMVLLLVAKGRTHELANIIKEYERLMDERSGIRNGTLRSAVELAADDVSQLENSISKKVGYRVKFKQEQDPNLLGGFVANVAGKTYDSSLRTQLARLQAELS